MQAYNINYTIKNENIPRSILVDAKDAKSAKCKIGKKHGYKDGRMVQIQKVSIIGYY